MLRQIFSCQSCTAMEPSSRYNKGLWFHRQVQDILVHLPTKIPWQAPCHWLLYSQQLDWSNQSGGLQMMWFPWRFCLNLSTGSTGTGLLFKCQVLKWWHRYFNKKQHFSSLLETSHCFILPTTVILVLSLPNINKVKPGLTLCWGACHPHATLTSISSVYIVHSC